MKDKNFQYTAEINDEGTRVDAFLVKRMETDGENASRSLIIKYKDRILVNGKTKKPSAKIKARDIIQFSIPPVEKLELVPQDVEFEIQPTHNGYLAFHIRPCLK